jgi:hypothetical protein
MPSRKDLAALLGESPQQPLRRGRGLRLSRAAKQARELAANPLAAPEPSASPPPLPESSATTTLPPAASPADSAAAAEESVTTDALAAEGAVVADAPIEPAVSADPALLKPARKKRKLQLRKDLLKQCKRIARAQDRKLYQVIEAALEEYIQRYGAPE